MKSADPEPRIRVIEEFENALAELGSGTARKCEGENVIRRSTLIDEIGTASGQCAGLSCPGASHDFEGALHVTYSSQWLRIQFVQWIDRALHAAT